MRQTFLIQSTVILGVLGMSLGMCSSGSDGGDVDNDKSESQSNSEGGSDNGADVESDDGDASDGGENSDEGGDSDDEVGAESGDDDAEVESNDDGEVDGEGDSEGEPDTDNGSDEGADDDSSADGEDDSEDDSESDSGSDDGSNEGSDDTESDEVEVSDTEVGEVTCTQAAAPFTVDIASLGADVTAVQASSGWGTNLSPFLSVAVDPSDNQVYVGLTQDSGGTLTAIIAGRSGVVAETPDAVNAGIAVTSDGFAQLVFDPNTSTDDRMWAAVLRFEADGSQRFNTDLFRSPNLEDEGTKGAPTTGRFGTIPESDELVAYFSHTQRYDDGVRHQGGYLALIDSSGEQNLLDGWFGSHNLDQRLLITEGDAAVLGLGDAYPEGIFFSLIAGRPSTNVIYQLASAGNGTTNGQLGGMVDLGDEIIIPFITNNSIDQNIDAGTWPDIDETVSDQINEAAENGTDMGLLKVAKGANPDEERDAVWVTPDITEGSSLVQLKSAPYGTDGLILLLWAEKSGGGWQSDVGGYFSMVVDRDGAVCQPKTTLDSQFAFTEGDDIIASPNGTIVWANADANGAVSIVTLTPQ